jgi:hypothetical protein
MELAGLLDFLFLLRWSKVSGNGIGFGLSFCLLAR